MDKVAEYWSNIDLGKNYKVPNVSLFRLLGSLIDTFKDKKILEIGFLEGADLLECKKRGANVYGIDINPIAVSKIEQQNQVKVKLSRCGVDPIPFDVSFELIYLRDTIYYLKDKEIEFFFTDASKKINFNGLIVIQFIEKDLYVKKQHPEEEFDFNRLINAKLEPIFEKENPIRFLSSRELIIKAEKAGLKLFATKRMLQSYDLDEERFRLDRYLVFKKK